MNIYIHFCVYASRYLLFNYRALSRTDTYVYQLATVLREYGQAGQHFLQFIRIISSQMRAHKVPIVGRIHCYLVQVDQ